MGVVESKTTDDAGNGVAVRLCKGEKVVDQLRLLTGSASRRRTETWRLEGFGDELLDESL